MKGTLNFKRMLTLTRRLQKCYTRCMSCGQIKTLGWRQHEHPIGQGRQLSSCTDTLPTDKYTPRRAVLYVPGNDERKLQKIAGLNVDCAVMDCEDGVAINRKEEARNTIKKMLDKLDFGRTECVVRVNSVDSGLIEDDLKVIFRADRMPQTIMLPKVNRPEEMYQFTDNLKESLKGRTQEQKLQLITFVESAIGLINLTEILRKTIELTNSEGLFNLAGVVFGSDDFCADIDLAGLEKQSTEGAHMGFTGKQVIHPGQIPVVQKAFSPSPDRVEWATELIQAFSQHTQTGKGAFTFRGAMIDMPLVLQARNIVRLAEAVKS